MKLIIAHIKPEKLSDVKKSLYAVGISNMSVTNALGCGRQKGYQENYRGAESEVMLFQKVRLEIGVNDKFVERATEAIREGARTGEPGDGVIFVMEMQQCIRIRTGETGDDAVG